MRHTIAALLLLASTPAFAQDKPLTLHKDEMAADAEKAWAKPPVEEAESVSHGAVTVGAARIAYTATAGTLTIRDNDGKPIASVFYTAYTRDGAAPGSRPVTFFYNGGPGSATIWLHMGSFGPVRVATTSPEAIRPAPYGFGPNPNSLIDKTDLVFIDAIGAGWSRPLGTKTGKDFWGVDSDADAFARAIERYVTRNARWSSPKFLFGESYGTLRSPAVAALLEDRGLSLNGIILLSTIMNYGVRQPGYDANYLGLFPGYAATAWYHNKVANRPASLDDFLKEVRAFAAGPYAAALAKGDTIPAAEKEAVAKQMSAYIGLGTDYILRADLRVELGRFMTELLRDRHLSVGRLDARYTLIPEDLNAADPDDDPASTAITGAYVASFMSYAKGTLGVKTELPYLLSARGEGWNWEWKHRAPDGSGTQLTPNTAVDLAYTMRINPHLKVLFLNGYYDLATPFFSTEFDVAHMGLDPKLRPNVSFRYYESGHMVYLNPDALGVMKRDLDGWYDGVLSGQ
ncbi:peptidase S10 [Sphingomonas sp.]|uniref:S10 family peptidase n=1 Tax=Sphingomonas sp. TaxID=28214 RepID=UPI001B204303|nr:peptidase S10 [Sphingomonas sp.]MBO9713352.1 peptidase S10 [Sphingomonas sp.]